MTPAGLLLLVFLQADSGILAESRLHLRSGETREWSSFPEQATGAEWRAEFEGAALHGSTLVWRQEDVRQPWTIQLNGEFLTELVVAEQAQRVALPIPADKIRAGKNLLQLSARKGPRFASDDIWFGPISIIPQTRDEICAAKLEVTVVDEKSGGSTPCRITIVDQNHNALQFTDAASNETQAVRNGVIYASSGSISCGVPPGKYVIYAGRGFEYSLAKAEITVGPGERVACHLSIRREVDTRGYVACDPHVHTFTFSRHGDATIDERMITLAGEGIELPIATDHDVLVDYEQPVSRLKLRPYFTPIHGIEFTTTRGHFCIFPVEPKSTLPDKTLTRWNDIFGAIEATPGVRVAILNHARDLHSGYRPFGPLLYNAVTAENLAGEPQRFQAMEVINSGATQTRPLELIEDWMGQLNRGRIITPVGSSDSHDVSRYIVGQGRTYIRVNDDDPSQVEVEPAIKSFLQGRVLVSYGLLAELIVNDSVRSGELFDSKGGDIPVEIRVSGPGWVNARQVSLYANGQIIHTLDLSKTAGMMPGLKQTWRLMLKKAGYDQVLTAVAIGDGIEGLYWQTAQPYQPTAPEFRAVTLGVSGAVRIDGDGDGQFQSARGYAVQLVKQSNGDASKALQLLEQFDQATASHVAELISNEQISLDEPALQSTLKSASPHVLAGFRQYREALREHEIAKAATRGP